MTITLDDVACLLGIPVTGRLLHDRELTRDEGIQMMHGDLLFTVEAVAKEVGRQSAAHVSFGNQLIRSDIEEEYEEQGQVRLACIKVFLLLLLGWTIFVGKNNKNINLLWLLALQDMDELGNWAWGAMGLAFLYEQLSLISDSSVASSGGYMTLLVAIIVFLIFYLLDR